MSRVFKKKGERMLRRCRSSSVKTKNYAPNSKRRRRNTKDSWQRTQI